MLYRVLTFLFLFLSSVTIFAQGVEEDLPVLGSPLAKKGGNFLFNLGVAPATLNPITAHDNYTVNVEPWLAETLLTHHEDNYRWIPLLAKSYKVSKNNRVFTFLLREGVKFHDGSDMTADDVQFSFQVYNGDLYKTAGDRESLKNIEKIEVLERFRIRFTMKASLFDNIDVLASTVILPKAIYGDVNQIPKLNKTIIATGPYRLKKYLPSDFMVLEANPDWWGRSLPFFRYKFNFDTITVRFATEQSSTVMRLEKGDLDYSGLTLDNFDRETTGPLWGKKVFAEHVRFNSKYTSQTSVFWNLRLPLFQDVKVRLALQMLLDRQWINDKMFGGRAVLATGPWHPLSEYADQTLPPVPYDPKAAAALLREQGWRDTDGDGILDKVIDGKKTDFRFTILIPKRDWEKLLTPYQSDLKKVGIAMDLKFCDWSLFMKAVDDLTYESYVVGRGFPGVIDFNPKYLWHSAYTGKGSDNNIGYKNPKVDALLERAETENNREKRIALLQDVYRLIAGDSSQLFWFGDQEAYYARSLRIKMEKPTYKYLLGTDYWWMEPQP